MRKRLLAITLVALLAIPLALVLRDFVRDVFVVEFLRVLWAGRILFESLPQWPMWVLLLLVLVFIAAGSLGRVTKPVQKEKEPEVAHQGQVQALARWIRRTTQGTYFRWRLANYLGKLAWDVMAYRAHTTPQVLKQRQRAGRLDMPPVVQEYLQSTQAIDFVAPPSFLSRLRARLGRGASFAAYDPALESVIQFLEAELEITSPLPADVTGAKPSWEQSDSLSSARGAIPNAADRDSLEVQHDH